MATGIESKAESPAQKPRFMALALTCRRCGCEAAGATALPLRPLAASGARTTPCRVLRRRVATAADAAPAPRPPPRLRLSRPAAQTPPPSEDSASALGTAARLLALGFAAAGGIGGGYFVGTAVREGLRPPTAAELEAAARHQQLEKAAAAGDNEAIHNLAIRYTTGVGVDQDVEKGVAMYRVAAEAGHAGARCRLGAAYRSGCGVEEDMVEALRHFELATAAGHPEAQFNLAVMIEAAGSGTDGATEAGAQQQKPADLARVRCSLLLPSVRSFYLFWFLEREQDLKMPLFTSSFGLRWPFPHPLCSSNAGA